VKECRKGLVKAWRGLGGRGEGGLTVSTVWSRDGSMKQVNAKKETKRRATGKDRWFVHRQRIVARKKKLDMKSYIIKAKTARAGEQPGGNLGVEKGWEIAPDFRTNRGASSTNTGREEEERNNGQSLPS